MYALKKYRFLRLFTLPDPDLIKLRNWLTIRDNLVKHKVSVLHLIENSKHAQTMAELTESLCFLKSELDDCIAKIKQIENQIETIVSSNTELAANDKLLTSIPGIGLLNAVLLLCVTDNFTRFNDHRKFASFCGVAPFEHSSGTSTCTSHLANREVKVNLTRAAITAVKWDELLKKYYRRKIDDGKHKVSVINAVRAKLIARCFAVVKHQTAFVKLVA